ncbi:MAG: MarR family transcriptional regulator [Coprobacillus sp.]
MFKDPVGHKIKTLSNLMKRNAERHFGKKPDEATLMHSWILGFLQHQEVEGKDTFQKDIEEEFSINRSTTSEMLKLMCKKGMIQRVAVTHDARLKKIVLTDQSREFNRMMDQKFKIRYEELVKGLTQEEIDEFAKIADKLIDNLRNVLDQA